MTVFTTFAFAATGSPTARTLPVRLAEIKNVRDFGAVGNGIANDQPAIMAAMNWVMGSGTYRGTVYFPPGTYYVGAPIDFGSSAYPDTGAFVRFIGEMGLSTVVGDFADYVFKRGLNSAPRWTGGDHLEKLTIINRHAGGGGIRLGISQGSYIRDCDITADIAINDDNTDEFIDGGNPNGSFEIDIQNCNCRPFNLRRTGSAGCYKLSSGPVTNCTFIGFDLGMGTSSGQGAATIHGCYFEGNNVGFATARGFNTWYGGGGNLSMSGCYFKNNGVALDNGGGNCTFLGIRIEAATGSIPGNPQCGIRVPSNKLGTSTFQGISITGAYQQAGVYIAGGENGKRFGEFIAVNSVNSAGPNWLGGAGLPMPPTAFTAVYKSCNVAPVFTVAQLPAYTAPITSTSWVPAIIAGTSAEFKPPGSKDPPSTGVVLAYGEGYVSGQYNNVPLTGGSGTGRRANIHVNFEGRVDQVLIPTPGTGYGVNDVLSANSANLGGSGSGFTVTSNFISGSGYGVNASYADVPLTGGSGTGAVADFQIDNGIVFRCILKVLVAKAGTNYVVGDVLSASNTNLGGSGSGFSIRVTAVQSTASVVFSTVPVDWANNLTENVALLSVAGTTPSGYNGIFQGMFINGNRIEYSLPTNPGGSGGAVGTVFFTASDRGYTNNVYEGQTYNVSDANTAAWGAAVTAGGGSNHVKVRYAASKWTVMGV